MQRRFGVGIGVWFRKAVAEDGCTRGSLVRGLCEFVDWRNVIMLHKFCKQFSRGIGHGKSIGFGINYPLNRKGRHHDRDGYGRPFSWSFAGSTRVRASRRRGRTWPRGWRSGRSRSRSFATGSRRRSRFCGCLGSTIFECARRTCLSV